MASSKQIKRLATDPAAYARFLATGQLPNVRQPGHVEGPLHVLLRQIASHDLVRIVGLTIDARLGYQGSRVFRNAFLALRWVCPDGDDPTWPSQSWRDRRFAGPVYLQDLQACASQFPEKLLNAYPRLARPGSFQPKDPAGPAEPQGEDAPEPRWPMG